MLRKLLLVGLGVLLLAVVFYGVRRPTPGRSRPPAVTAAPRAPTSVASGLELTDVDPDGTRWRISAQQGSGWEQKGTGTLVGIEAVFEKKGRELRVRAGRAAVESGIRLDLADGVNVAWDGYEAALDRAEYHRGRITSDSPVLLKGRGVTIRGRGIEVDVETRNARIRSEVRAVIEGGVL